MPIVNYGRKDEPGFTLELSDDLLAVRTRSGRSLVEPSSPVPLPASDELADGTLVASFPEAGVEVYRVPRTEGRTLESRKSLLKASPDVRFAGGVLIDGAGSPVLYTENIFIKFIDTLPIETCHAVLRERNLAIKEKVSYATNAFFVGTPEDTGRKVFDIAQELLSRDDVEYCHPELIRRRGCKRIFPQQWHLKRTSINGALIDASAQVEAAHALSRGEGITIAIIDDGFDIDHPEFASEGKIVAPRDMVLGTDDPRPKDQNRERADNHGTACAGVALADGAVGCSGVAPAARLMPIVIPCGLGSHAHEANAIAWAADHGADVISCSWGPEDGKWFNRTDSLHGTKVEMAANVKLAIDHAVTNGRGGKGCVVVFAAGNGNEPVENDGYASYDKVIAVAACNDTGRRSVYSDFGRAIWCAFPSSDTDHAPSGHPRPLTRGIWTTDRTGRAGYNNCRNSDGDLAGMFTGSFGGTSSACPGVAGIVALVLAVNPSLRVGEVKDLLRRACDQIDPQGGQYDADGHSPFYGYGRLNARTAVELARPQPRNEMTISRRFDTPIPSLHRVSFPLEVGERTPVEGISVAIDLQHNSVRGLSLSLEPPASTGLPSIALNRRNGGARDALKEIYDATTVQELAACAGRPCNGTWTLHVTNETAESPGTLVAASIRLRLPRSGGTSNSVNHPPRKRKGRKAAKKKRTDG